MLSVLVLGVPLASRAQPKLRHEMTPLERQVKAAFLFKFTGYVQWPAGALPDPATPLTVGVAGDDRLAGELGRLVAGRTVSGRTIQVRSVGEADPLDGLHVLFVTHERRGEIERSAQAARPILIVTDWPGALRQGGMLNFVMVDGRVRFEVSLAATERRGLALSSRLLAVAEAIRTRRH